MKKCCPGCGQGWVIHAYVPSLNREVFICEECETTWMKYDDIGVQPPLNFVNFMREHGLKGLWTEIVQVQELQPVVSAIETTKQDKDVAEETKKETETTHRKIEEVF